MRSGAETVARTVLRIPGPAKDFSQFQFLESCGKCRMQHIRISRKLSSNWLSPSPSFSCCSRAESTTYAGPLYTLLPVYFERSLVLGPEDDRALDESDFPAAPCLCGQTSRVTLCDLDSGLPREFGPAGCGFLCVFRCCYYASAAAAALPFCCSRRRMTPEMPVSPAGLCGTAPLVTLVPRFLLLLTSTCRHLCPGRVGPAPRLTKAACSARPDRYAPD
jgi:hypothetical protein